jgi:hypothetical protein
MEIISNEENKLMLEKEIQKRNGIMNQIFYFQILIFLI